MLLAALILLGVAGEAPAAETIRVALVEGARSVELAGDRIEVTAGQGCCARPLLRADVVRATAAGARVEVEGRRAVRFRLRSGQPIRVNGREHPGPLDLVRHGAGIAVVSELGLEEYIAGVVRAEVGERWPFEALRAQAVVARTYAAFHRQLNGDKPYHVTASTAHQVYAGAVPATSPAWAAAQETAGRVLALDGQLFPAFYHAESGGYTEEPRAVFAARNLPPLRPVVCPFSAGSPHYAWSLDLPLEKLTDALRRGGIDVGPISGLEVAERASSLRASTVIVRGPLGTATVRGNDLRRLVGYETLRSTLFAVVVDGDVARFAGRGYGHGVGMCQWGARGMAEAGYTMSQILEFYYPGTALTALRPR